MSIRALLKVAPVGILLTILTPAASHAEGALCPEPSIQVVPQPAGRRQFSIKSPCRKGELVIGRYGEVVIMERLDQAGNLAFQLDCFLGDQDLVLTFADNRHASSHACAPADSRITKVAIVWQDHVDLDLHAFEYAAVPGSAYDRSVHNPGSFQMAQSEYARSGRSFGFMSTVSDGQQLGHNIEVYTLLRHPAEPRGLIAMAVGLGKNDDADACATAPLRVDLDVYVLDQGSRLRSYERTFTAPLCNGEAARYVTNLVPNIQLGTAGGTANAP